MSNENQTSIGSAVVSYVAFPALFSARHIKNAVQYYKKDKYFHDALKTFSDNLGNIDRFEKSNILLKHYEELAAAKKQSLTLWEKFCNLFKQEAIKTKPRMDELNNIEANLLSKEYAGALTKSVNGSFIQNFGKNFKNLFSTGVKDKAGIIITVLCAIPEFIEKVIPKFKEGKIGEGFKETGKWAIKTGVDFLSFVTGNALGTIIGSLIIPIPGIGAAIGRTFMGMLGVSAVGKVSGKIVNKILGEDKPKEEIEEKEQIQNPLSKQNFDMKM